MNTRWLLSLAVVFPIGASLGACATGSSYSGAGGDTGSDSTTQGPGPTSAASTSAGQGGAGQGGAGQGGAGPSSTSTAGPGSGSSSSSGGGPCPTPCKLVAPQCGCAAGEGCSLDNTGAPACEPSGNVAPGAACSAANNCAPGGICIGKSPICAEFCDNDNQCVAPGGLCAVTLSDANGNPIPNVKLCSENCNPTTNVGCAAGTGCTFGQEAAGQMRFFTACRDIGSGTQGAACTTNADCAATYGCINTGTTQCMKYCTVGSTCAGGGACNPISINMVDITIGGVQYGICL